MIDDEIVVVIPAKDAEATLGTALASVAGQTLLPGAIVVVDDGSSDETGALARSWASLLPIEVITNDVALGPAAARDAAIRSGQRPIVALLDADDVWLPEHLSSLRNCLREGYLVTADALVWLPGEGVSRDTWRDRTPIPPEAQLHNLVKANFVFVGTMFTADDYLRSGRFRSSGVEDWDLWIRMVAAGVTVVGAPGPTVLYRVTATSRSANDAQLPAHIELLERLRDELAGPDVRVSIDESLRRHRARLALVESYRLARLGHAREARRAALGGLRGSRNVAARSLAMMVAPSAGASLQRALKFSPSRWLQR